ncbi:MAG TPA: LysM peptidoglycan-binding domain-containing protein [Verrucomicrobiae bacterium]|nr:LysM peptidoglycan-binding domain-containing protein [Verrucomicrobiae bacterium]
MRRWVLVLALLFAGCTPEAKLKPADNDFETPVFLRAKEKFELRDYEGAIVLYEEVVRANPNMAKAHLELGLIYDDKLGDYVSAIYHYRRFLKLRPDSDKARIVKQWITRAELAFAAQQPNSPLQNADELARLQKDNINLKAQIEEAHRVQREMQAQLKAALAQPIAPAMRPGAPVAVEERPQAQPVARPAPPQVVQQPQPPAPAVPAPRPQAEKAVPVAVPVAPPTPAPTAQAPQEPTVRMHVVQEGETLWRIASRYYPGNVQRGVEKIQEANKGTVADVTKLRVGQQLRVP